MSRTISFSRRSRALRWVAEVAPAFAVAVLLLPWIIATGKANPWQPAMIDLDVYRAAATDLIAGKDIYLTRTPYYQLPFIYPPIAAILAVVLVWLPVTLSQLLWTGLTILAQRLVLARAGIARGWRLGLCNVVLVLAFEPFRTTLGYGQVNTLLLALVVGDLLPRAVGERRWLPRGVATGLAAAIKLTPLLFLVFALLSGRRRVAIVGGVSTLVFTGIGFWAMPAESLTFARKVITGDTYGDPVYVGNQSLSAVFARLQGTDPATVRLATLVSAVAVVIGLLAAVAVARRGEQVLAVGLIGATTCLASPLSWTHHHVWALLVGLGALQALRNHRGGLAQPGSGGVRPGSPPGLGEWVCTPWLVYAVWVAMCPVLDFLPYGQGKERSYSPALQVVADFLPLLACVGLLVTLVASWPNLRRGATVRVPVAARPE